MKTIVEIREMFFDYFKIQLHNIISESSLIIDKDPSLLFTNAGMNQFKDNFLGTQKSENARVVTSQKCLRVGGKHNDLENVGYSNWHHTLFEMLGNFSFGDYFKKEAIQFAWDFLTKKNWMDLDKNKLLITVYIDDEESYNIWNNVIHVSSNQIIRIGDKNKKKYISDNFWQMGDIGPCGPCSEIFYDLGEKYQNNNEFIKNDINISCSNRYVEIWNLVFMQFNRQLNGRLDLLNIKSVDTGMGLERITAVVQNVFSTYDIDIFQKLLISIKEFIEKDINKYNLYSFRVIADHMRAIILLISYGITPSNEGKGYILRKIIRRAIFHGNMIGIKDIFLYKLVSLLINDMQYMFLSINLNKFNIENVIKLEEERYFNVIKLGINILESKIKNLKSSVLDGKTAFYLHDTYGFPLHLTLEICRNRNIEVNTIEFNYAMESQRKKGRMSSTFRKDDKYIISLFKDNYQETKFIGYDHTKKETYILGIFKKINNVLQNVKELIKDEEGIIILKESPFYAESGGQIGDKGIIWGYSGLFNVFNTIRCGNILLHIGSVENNKIISGIKIYAEVDENSRKFISINHSATHLLNSALRKIFRVSIIQKGSLINEKYLRFDFLCSEKINMDKILYLEKVVNQQIQCNFPIKIYEESWNTVLQKKYIYLYDKKYNDNVRVVKIGNFSKELCGGTHTSFTGNIGFFHIISIMKISIDVYRIEAVTGIEAIETIHKNDILIQKITDIINITDKSIVCNKIQSIVSKNIILEKELLLLQKKISKNIVSIIIKEFINYQGFNYLIKLFYNENINILFNIIHFLKHHVEPSIIILLNVEHNYIKLIICVYGNSCFNNIQSNVVLQSILKKFEGKGGGNYFIAQGILNKVNNLIYIKDEIRKIVEKLIYYYK